MALNDKERQILRAVESDPCASPDRLATMVDLSTEEVRTILSDFHQQGIILRYRGVINWEKAGDPLVVALIEVRVTPQREVGFDAIAQRIARFPEVRSLYLASGTYDLAVQVAVATMHDVARFVASKIAPIEGVQGTTTHFLLKTYKEDGVMIEGGEQPARLPIVP